MELLKGIIFIIGLFFVVGLVDIFRKKLDKREKFKNNHPIKENLNEVSKNSKTVTNNINNFQNKQNNYEKYRRPVQKTAVVLEESKALANNQDFLWDEAFLKSLEWKRYEEICKEYLRIFCNANVTGIGADGGIDITVATKTGNIICVAQCKAWSKKLIGVSQIRELKGVMASDGVDRGMFFTTSVFSNDAKEFAKKNKITLIDSDNFINTLNKLDSEKRIRLNHVATWGDFTTPTCVKCDVKMVKRVGRDSGKEFWGCSNYPKCNNTMFVKK